MAGKWGGGGEREKERQEVAGRWGGRGGGGGRGRETGVCRVVGIQCLSKGEKRFRRGSVRDARRKSLFDWPVAFTKVILMVANCTLAKREREKTKQNKTTFTVFAERAQSSGAV